MSICAINSISKRKDVFGAFCQESKKRQNAYFALIVLCNIWLNTINSTVGNILQTVGKTAHGGHKCKVPRAFLRILLLKAGLPSSPTQWHALTWVNYLPFQPKHHTNVIFIYWFLFMCIPPHIIHPISCILAMKNSCKLHCSGKTLNYRVGRFLTEMTVLPRDVRTQPQVSETSLFFQTF